jgi:ankyrin repeat protein
VQSIWLAAGIVPSVAHMDILRSHFLGVYNDVDRLSQLASENTSVLFSKDCNGWQPIHEAACGGHEKILDFLVNNGANVNARMQHAGLGVTT